ncbi:hypothetical protein [Corynebacterium renale]|uniref:hypothetical protein n=1 Tax=Corynebacterium renale TaxID=1724 RepID=UPI00128AEDDD|nr:hypothetical protein [Corynebacterium renale]
MNTLSMALTALNASRSALSALNEYREKKQSQAYDALVDVTENLPDDLSKEAGALTASAKRRLAQTWDKATDAASDAAETVTSEAKRLGSDGKKMSKRLAKKADKAADKARAKAQKKIDKRAAKSLVAEASPRPRHNGLGCSDCHFGRLGRGKIPEPQRRSQRHPTARRRTPRRRQIPPGVLHRNTS